MCALRAMAGFLISIGCATGQTDARPEFEVASIKPAAPEERGMWIRPTPGGRVNITNMTLKELIVIAWRVQPFQVSGGPPWLDSARYDISAKAEKSFGQGELPLMIQSLLTDRFQLTIHNETKELPIYALVLARKDGKLGPGLTEAKQGSCTPFDPSKPLPPPDPGKPPTLGCGGVFMGVGGLRGTSIPVTRLTPVLSRTLGRTVIDKTGLTANFDVKLEWTPDNAQAAPGLPDAPNPPPADASGPSIFTALQEQLGLKLAPQKGPVEIIVIDRAEKPSAN
jgi:uncharacterized protein (TIGR03435 family)